VSARRWLAGALAAASLVTVAGCSSSAGDQPAPAAVAVATPPRPADGLRGPYPVVRVVDGDTIIVRTPSGDERVRMIGIDTPESVAPNRPVECFGPEASAETARLLDGAAVDLEMDPGQGERDRYDRLLAYVWRGDRLINLDLIASGFGYEYTYDDAYAYQREFQDAERRARATQEGLWAVSACGSA
jgi:micrococcal nuclease